MCLFVKLLNVRGDKGRSNGQLCQLLSHVHTWSYIHSAKVL